MGLFVLYTTILLVTYSIALSRWIILSKADRWVCLLLFVALIDAPIDRYFFTVFHNNFRLYHIYTPLELAIIVQYFNESNNFIKSKYSFAINLFLCYLLGVLNMVFLQDFDHLNSYYLLFEGCVIIGMCLISLYKLLLREDIVPAKMSHFWINTCFLFYWSLTYANFALYAATFNSKDVVTQVFNLTLVTANDLFYAGLGVIFLFYKKLIPSGE